MRTAITQARRRSSTRPPADRKVKLRFRAGTHDDMARVFAELSDLHRDELEKTAACNGVPVQTVYEMIAAWVDMAGCKVAYDHLGFPLCAYSELDEPAEPGLRRVWFFVTKHFMDDFAVYFRAFRNHCKTRIEVEPDHRWTTVSFTMNPRAGKWARALGFNRIEPDGLGLRFTLERDPAKVPARA